jgi:hypothetical protein
VLRGLWKLFPFVLIPFKWRRVLAEKSSARSFCVERLLCILREIHGAYVQLTAEKGRIQLDPL